MFNIPYLVSRPNLGKADVLATLNANHDEKQPTSMAHQSSIRTHLLIRGSDAKLRKNVLCF